MKKIFFFLGMLAFLSFSVTISFAQQNGNGAPKVISTSIMKVSEGFYSLSVVYENETGVTKDMYAEIAGVAGFPIHCEGKTVGTQTYTGYFSYEAPVGVSYSFLLTMTTGTAASDSNGAGHEYSLVTIFNFF